MCVCVCVKCVFRKHIVLLACFIENDETEFNVLPFIHLWGGREEDVVTVGCIQSKLYKISVSVF